MFRFISRLLGYRADPPPPPRCLFPFWDGQHWRTVDPHLTRDTLFRIRPDVVELMTDLMTGDEADARIAEHFLLTATREAFGVEQFDGTNSEPRGLTVVETLGLLKAFLTFTGNITSEANANV
ncbi:MAG: hypothetical protein K8U57_14170 [Planctomycetes bacterium]|nr:hypothetical protein [Planctomycetota bacterium]